MSNSLIGIGKCSKYYWYILGAILFRCLKDCIFGFVAIDPESKIGLIGFIPELSNHYLIQDFYKYISFAIGGAIFMKILKKNSQTEEEKLNIKRNKTIKLKTLIYNDKNHNLKSIPIRQILVICMIFCIHLELSRIMYLFDFNGLDFWTFDIIFTLFFMDVYFIFNYYKHQIFSMVFIIVINTILLLISSFLKNTNNESSELKNKNTYEIIEMVTGSKYLFIAVLFIFIFLSGLLAFGRVKVKIFMYFNYLSPYKIIFCIGLIGSVLTFIGLIFASFFDCSGKLKNIENYCIMSKTENGFEKYYYDNIFIYFKELKNNIKNYRFYLEIIIITPLFLSLEFFGFACEMLIIYYLNPIYVLIRENLYYCILRFIFILSNIDNYTDYITSQQFFILQTSEIMALLGYIIYLEIIELRFCGLDKDLRRNIIIRGERETIQKPLDDNSFEENCDLNQNSFDEERNKMDEKREELDIV